MNVHWQVRPLPTPLLHPFVRSHVLHGILHGHRHFNISLFPWQIASLHRRQVRMAWRLRCSSGITRRRLVAVRPTDGSSSTSATSNPGPVPIPWAIDSGAYYRFAAHCTKIWIDNFILTTYIYLRARLQTVRTTVWLKGNEMVSKMNGSAFARQITTQQNGR